jgi:GGDEF domain-containing protein
MEMTLADLGQVGFVWRFSDGTIDFHGEAAAVLGIEPHDVPKSAHAFKSLINPQDLPDFMTALQSHASHLDGGVGENGIRVSEPFRLRMRDGTHRTMRLEGRIITDAQSHAPLLTGVMRRIDKQTASDSNILSTRAAIATVIETILLTRSAGVRNRGFFMAIGLDRVGLLNAAHGASFVDTILVEVEKRLGVFLDGKASVGRVAGDVYGLIFEDLPHGEADTLAAGLLQMFTSTPVLTIHGPVMVGLSIGGAALINTEEKGSDIIARAESALAEAKKKGRGCFIVSAPITDERIQARALLSGGQAVYDAMEEGRMRMAFQPVMDIDQNKVVF